jgi:hypothetical protein
MFRFPPDVLLVPSSSGVQGRKVQSNYQTDTASRGGGRDGTAASGASGGAGEWLKWALSRPAASGPKPDRQLRVRKALQRTESDRTRMGC